MYVDNPFINPTTISFCTGYGGLDAGIEQALGGSRTEAYVEIEAAAIFFLVEQMEKGLVAPAPVWTDAKSFHAEPFRDRIHGITAGYPCQPFSVAGGRGGENDPRHLFPHLRRSYNTIRPVWCYFENVRGHLSMGFDEVYRSLRADGYAVEFGIFSAEEVGATHQRERLFILAIRQDWLEYASKQGLQITGHGGLREHEKKTGRRLDRRFEFSSNEELADSEQVGVRTGFGNLREEDGEVSQRNDHAEPFNSDKNLMDDTTGKRLEPEYEIQTRRNAPFNANQINLANSQELGMERCGTEGEQELRTHAGPEIPMRESGIYSWPLPPGPYQWEWEAQRAVKSGMGCTVDGFNFREDLLRLLGNGVVPQTAALAFQVLLRKFKL